MTKRFKSQLLSEVEKSTHTLTEHPPVEKQSITYIIDGMAILYGAVKDTPKPFGGVAQWYFEKVHELYELKGVARVDVVLDM